MITTLPGSGPSKAGAAGRPLFGISLKIVDEEGKEVAVGQQGYLLVLRPWPSMMRTILGDHQRFIDQYWQKIPGAYFTGDYARCDEDGYYWILGRCDDVINVAAHRISTMEVESALVAHPAVAEAAAVGAADEIKGQQVVCFVTLKNGLTPTDELRLQLSNHIVHHIGVFARPREVIIVEALPKTRSGKIMRRLLRDRAEGRETQGDISTLESSLTLVLPGAKESTEQHKSPLL